MSASLESPPRSYRSLFWTLALVGLTLDLGSKYAVFSWLYNDGAGGQVTLIPGAFNLLAQYTRERELGTDLLAQLRTVSGNHLPRVNQGALFGLGADAFLPVINWLAATTIIYFGFRRCLVKNDRLFAALKGGGIYAYLTNAIIVGVSLLASVPIYWSTRQSLAEDSWLCTSLGLGGKNGYGYLTNAIFALVSFAAAVAIIYWSTRRSLAKDSWLSCALGLILAGTLGNLFDRIVFSGVRDFLHWYYFIDWPVFNIADSCLVCGAGLLLLQALVVKPAEKPQATPPAAAEPVAMAETSPTL